MMRTVFPVSPWAMAACADSMSRALASNRATYLDIYMLPPSPLYYCWLEWIEFPSAARHYAVRIRSNFTDEPDQARSQLNAAWNSQQRVARGQCHTQSEAPADSKGLHHAVCRACAPQIAFWPIAQESFARCVPIQVRRP